jgi:hypothetical protein
LLIGAEGGWAERGIVVWAASPRSAPSDCSPSWAQHGRWSVRARIAPPLVLIASCGYAPQSECAISRDAYQPLRPRGIFQKAAVMTVTVGKRDAVLIVDVQRDFLPGGNLAVAGGDGERAEREMRDAGALPVHVGDLGA